MKNLIKEIEIKNKNMENLIKEIETMNLNQLYGLADILDENSRIRDRFLIKDKEELTNILRKITYKQYKYIHYLLISRKFFKLYEVLKSIGFQPKI